jgi:hypothetical protein
MIAKAAFVKTKNYLHDRFITLKGGMKNMIVKTSIEVPENEDALKTIINVKISMPPTVKDSEFVETLRRYLENSKVTEYCLYQPKSTMKAAA